MIKNTVLQNNNFPLASSSQLYCKIKKIKKVQSVSGREKTNEKENTSLITTVTEHFLVPTNTIDKCVLLDTAAYFAITTGTAYM